MIVARGFFAASSCKKQLQDATDRCAGQKNRKRYTFATHYGEITSVNSSTMLAHGTSPESFATVLRQTCLSAEASHNVFVVDTASTFRGVFTLQSFVTVTCPPCKDHIRIRQSS